MPTQKENPTKGQKNKAINYKMERCNNMLHLFFCIFVLLFRKKMGIGSTPMDVHLKISVLLSDAVAWFDAHTPEVKKMITELIKQNQLKNKGVDKFNNVIGLYAWTTAQIDPSKAYGTPYTLDDSGVFYQSMFVVVLKNSILIEAETSHMEDQQWWSTNILGLNEQNLAIYTEKIRQNFIQYTRFTLGIN